MKLKLIDYNNKIEEYIASQEFEKKRIAGELHDTSLQTLAHIIHQIEIASLFVDKDPIRAKLELATVNTALKDVIEEIRNTIYNLIPTYFDDLSFSESIEQYVAQLNLKSKINYSYSIENIDIDDSTHRLIIFRIIQEALNNSEKHSNAKNVKIRIFCDKLLNIIIKDDGIGFDVEKSIKLDKHFGLKLLYDRVNFLNGEININSFKNKGVTIDIKIPYIN